MMTLERVLFEALNRREKQLIADYARCDAASPEQLEVAEDLEKVALQLDMEYPFAVPCQEFNWGNDCLSALAEDDHVNGKVWLN